MKKLFLGICLSFLSPIVFAQSLNGRVTDKTANTPVSGATVTLSAGPVTATAENGSFLFSKLKPGTYQLTVTNIGYKTVIQSVTVSGNTSVDIQLEKIDLLLQPIEVRAVRAADIAPFSKTNISGKEIAKSNLGQDLPFLIQQTPSVIAASDAGNGVGYTSWRIRGTDVTRINMTINGIPYNDAESQGTFFVNLPDFASSVNSIQIQRGVGTSSNGAGSFGGSINFSTNEFNEKAYAEINNSYGSFNTWKNTVKAGTGLLNNHFTIDARLSRISSDGFIDRASSDLKSAYLSAAWLAKNSSLRFNLIKGKEKTYQAWYGVPAELLETHRTFNPSGMEKPGEPYDNETDNYQQDHYQLFYNQTISARLQLNTAVFLSRGKGYYENYRAGDDFLSYGLSNPVIGGTEIEETDLIRQLWLDNYYYGGIYSLQYKNDRHEFTLGGGLNQYKGNHYGKVIWAEIGFPKDHEWYNLDALKTDFSTYAKWRYRLLTNLHIFGDLQYRNINYKIDGFRKNPTLIAHNKYNFFNPKAGLTYTRNNWMAFASYAVGNKEPNRDDFEASATATPKHETLHNIEAGVQHRKNRYSWGATVYYMNYKNQLVFNGAMNDVGAYQRINIPRSYRLGIELEGSAQLADWISATGNIALSRNKIKEVTLYFDNDFDPQIAETYTNADISYSPSVVGALALRLLPFRNMEINLPAKYVSAQYMENTGRKETRLDDYYVQDLQLLYTIPQKLVPHIQLLLHVNNLFDRKYEPNGSSYTYFSGNERNTALTFFPMAGINFMAGLSIRL